MRRCIILVNKIKDAINFMLKSDGKRAKIIVAMGLVAIVLIAFSSFFSQMTIKQPKMKRRLIIRNIALKLKNS